MGFRPTLTNGSVGSQTVDAKVGEAYHVVKAVADNLPLITALGENIDGITSIFDNMDELLDVDEKADTAEAAATLAELKAGQSSSSATTAVAAKVAAEAARDSAEGYKNTASTKATEAAASAAEALAAAGVAGGHTFTYSTTITDSDPGAGTVRLNHGTLGSVTYAFFDNVDSHENSVSAWLDSLDDSSSTIKGHLALRSLQDVNSWANFRVTGSVVNGTGYRKVPVSLIASSGTFGNGDTLSAGFTQTGDAGDGAVTSVNTQSGAVILSTDDLSDVGKTNKWATAGEKTKIGNLTVTAATDLDTMRTDVAASKTKTDHLAVTGATDLDAMRARVLELDAAVILKGGWDATSGSFPGSGAAQAGWSYVVTNAGTVDGIAFSANDRLLAIADNASTGTYAADWLKLDYSDLVSAVAGLTGSISGSALKSALSLVVGDITDMSANGRSLAQAADYAAMRTLLGLVIGTNVQAYSARLGDIATIGTPAADRVMIWDQSAGAWVGATMNPGIVINGTEIQAIETWGLAGSDTSTALTTGTNKASLCLPYAIKLLGVAGTLNSSSSSDTPTIDINENGNSILSTKMVFDVGELSAGSAGYQGTAAAAAVISDDTIAAFSQITVDIDVAGADAKRLAVYLIGYRTT